MIEQTDIDGAIERLVAYSAAGADVLYAPWVTDLVENRAIVEAVAPKPVNVLLRTPRMQVADLAGIGVRRMSTGGWLGRYAWDALERAAVSIRDDGHMPE